MKIVTICIYTTICFLIVDCKRSTSTIRDYDTVENYATELEKLCLKCHDDSVTFSFKTKEEGYITEYDFKYLGSLKIKRDNFMVNIQNLTCFTKLRLYPIPFVCTIIVQKLKPFLS